MTYSHCFPQIAYLLSQLEHMDPALILLGTLFCILHNSSNSIPAGKAKSATHPENVSFAFRQKENWTLGRQLPWHLGLDACHTKIFGDQKIGLRLTYICYLLKFSLFHQRSPSTDTASLDCNGISKP
jgi:hypothetical protein